MVAPNSAGKWEKTTKMDIEVKVCKLERESTSTTASDGWRSSAGSSTHSASQGSSRLNPEVWRAVEKFTKPQSETENYNEALRVQKPNHKGVNCLEDVSYRPIETEKEPVKDAVNDYLKDPSKDLLKGSLKESVEDPARKLVKGPVEDSDEEAAAEVSRTQHSYTKRLNSATESMDGNSLLFLTRMQSSTLHTKYSPIKVKRRIRKNNSSRPWTGSEIEDKAWLTLLLFVVVLALYRYLLPYNC